MRAKNDSMPLAVETPTVSGQGVSIFVEDSHPLLQLHRALDGDAIRMVMIQHWRAAGKNLDSRPGQPWPVDLDVPLVVLYVVKAYHARQMEDYLNESVVARAFVGLSQLTQFHLRDHASLARAVTALGSEAIAHLNELIISKAQEFGFTGPEILSSDPTVQEPLLPYPNEPTILKGLSQRLERAFVNLKRRGLRAAKTGLHTVKEIYKSVKPHHLFAKTGAERQQLLTRIVEPTEVLICQSPRVIAAVGNRLDRVKQAGVEKLKAMSEVGRVLLPQSKQWMQTGKVATEKIIDAGLSEARSIVTDKAGRRVKFGFKWLSHRLKGG